MDKGSVKVYYGSGKGKTTMAIGYGIRAASEGKNVIIIQFLKAKSEETLSFIRRLEPEIKLFRFEKCDCDYNELTEEQKEDEIQNIKNGMHYAKKVLSTGECQVLILDEVLGLFDMNIIDYEDIKLLFAEKNDETELILTGMKMYDKIADDADEIFQVSAVKGC